MPASTQAHLAIRLLDTAMRLVRWILLVATPVAIVLAVLVVFGVGSVSLAGSADEIRPIELAPGEYQIREGDQLFDVAETTVFESDDGAVHFLSTEVRIEIGDSAFAVRSVAVGLVLAWLALAWIGVTNLGALAESSRDGKAFTTANTRRLRRVGWAAIAFPVLTTVGQSTLRSFVDALDLAGPAVTVDVAVGDWWAWVVAGFLLLAIAEVFTHGVTLRELDEATI